MATNVVNHFSLTARGLKLVIKRSSNFLSVQNTRGDIDKNERIQLPMLQCLSLVVEPPDVIGGGRDSWGIDDDTSRRKSVVCFFVTFDTGFRFCIGCVYVIVFKHLWKRFANTQIALCNWARIYLEVGKRRWKKKKGRGKN